MTCPGAVLMAAPAASAAHGNGCNPPQLPSPQPQVARRLAFLCPRSSRRVTHPAVARPVNATGRRCVRLRVRVRALPRGLHSTRLRCFGRRASQCAQSARSARASSVLGAWCKVQGARRVLSSHVLRAASQRTRFARSVRAGSGLSARGLANATGRRRVRLRAHVRTLPRELFSPRLRCSGRRASQRARFVRSARACSMSRARRSVLGAWCGLGPRVLRAASPRAQSARSVHAGSTLGARGSVNATGRRRVHLRAHVCALPRGLLLSRLRCSGRRASPRARFARSVRARLVLAARFSVLGSSQWKASPAR